MSPLAMLVLFGFVNEVRKGGGAYVPPSGPTNLHPADVPPGTAVTSMRAGGRYRVTLLFNGTGGATPTPDILMASANVAVSPASAFQVTPALTKVVQNTDGSWAAQVVGTYKGGDVVFGGGGAWTLLALETA